MTLLRSENSLATLHKDYVYFLVYEQFLKVCACLHGLNQKIWLEQAGALGAGELLETVGPLKYSHM